MIDAVRGITPPYQSLRTQAALSLAFISLPFYQALTGSTNYVHLGWGFFLSLASVLFGYGLGKDHGRLLGLSFLYFSFQAIYLIAFPNRYDTSPSEIRVHFSFHALYFLVALFVLPYFTRQRFFEGLFPLLGCLNGLYTTLGALFGFSKLSDGYGYSGILDYPSVNGLFTVTCYFLWIRKAKRSETVFATALTLLAVLFSKSSTPLGAFVIGVVALHLRSPKSLLAPWRLLVAFLAGLLLLALGYSLDPLLFSSQGRVEAWGVFMQTWCKTFPVFFGSGPGTFSSLAIETQLQKNYMVGQYYLYLHNEWLQILYETGLIGLTLVSSLFALSLYKSFKRSDHYTVAALLSFGSGCFLVFPLRYFWGALLAVHLLSVGLEGFLSDSDKGYESGRAG